MTGWWADGERGAGGGRTGFRVSGEWDRSEGEGGGKEGRRGTVKGGKWRSKRKNWEEEEEDKNVNGEKRKDGRGEKGG